MTDSLYRISLKCLVMNDEGEVLIVKERGRDWWDLPGGGMDHGEDLHTAIARELKEEAGFEGNFSYRVVDIEDPAKLLRDIWQLRIILEIRPDTFNFSVGDQSDELQFMHPDIFKNAERDIECRIYNYAQKALTLYHL